MTYASLPDDLIKKMTVLGDPIHNKGPGWVRGAEDPFLPIASYSPLSNLKEEISFHCYKLFPAGLTNRAHPGWATSLPPLGIQRTR